MKKDLKSSIHDFYQKKTLTSKQLRRLESLTKKDENTSIEWWQRKILFIPSISLISIVCISFFIFEWDVIFSPMEEEIAQEVAYHFNKNLNSEIKISNFNEAQGKFNKLDFNMISPDFFSNQEWELIGARYCSIQKKLGVQIKLKNKKNNQIYSVYQIPDYHLPKKRLLKPVIMYNSGVKVKLWREKGIVNVLAGK